MASVFVVELVCLACGRDRQVTVPTLAELPELPARCEQCSGSVLAVSSTQRVVRDVVLIDWATRSPRRGRPPAHPQLSLLDPRGGEATA